MIKPIQKNSYKEKTQKWVKENIDYAIDVRESLSDLDVELDKYYEAVDGNISEDEYSYVLNPYGAKVARKQPARIRNLNIIAPVINLFMGEMGKTPLNHTVICHNSNREAKVKVQIQELVAKSLSQQFVNDLNAAGIDTGIPTKEAKDPAEIQAKTSEEFNDEMAKMGDEALNYVKYHLRIRDKVQEAFYDWLVIGRVFSYKTEVNGEIYYEIIPYNELKYNSSNVSLLEDRDWCLRTTKMTLSEIIDLFRGRIKEEHIVMLEERENNSQKVTSTFLTPRGGWIHYRSFDTPTKSVLSTGGDHDVSHFVWKTFRKIGKLTYIGLEGVEIQREVSEDYKLDESKGDINIKWEWIDEVWETWKIADNIYLDGSPIIVQRNSINNSSECKLPYNGLIGYNKRSKSVVSIVKTGFPYQLIYNIFNFRGEMTLARSKDKVMMMPKGLLPTGFDEYKFMYFLDTTGVGWYDETKPNAAALTAAIKSIDMGLGTYISDMNKLMMDVKAEWWDSVGCNRQRFGSTYASDGKGVNEQALFRSSLMTAEMVRKFGEFVESDLAGLLDYTKIAWIEGKTGYYLSDDKTMKYINILPIHHMLAEYGVYLSDLIDEKEKIDMFRGQAQNMIQNKVPIPIVAEVLDSNSFRSIKRFLQEGEKVQKKYEEYLANIQGEKAKEVQGMKNENDAANREVEYYTVDVQAKTDLEIAYLNNNTKVQVADMKPANIKVDPLKEEKDLQDMKLKEQAAQLANEKFEQVKTAHKDKMKLQRKSKAKS